MVGVIFGGNSFEHEISIVSAITLKDKIDATFIYLDENREFYLIEKENLKSKFFATKEYKKSQKLNIKKGGFEYKKGIFKKELRIEYVINLIHGKDGEDGKLAALLEFYEIKAITPNIEASVISFNKLYTKMFAKEIGVNVIEYEAITAPKTSFNFPVILKPARLGSSIGVSIAKTEEEFKYAFDVAREFDELIIVEPFIEGIEEYNLAGCYAGEWVFSKLEKVEKREFLDFEKKYLDFSRKEIKFIEDKELKKEFIKVFKKIYYPTFQNALIRCDFFYKDGKIYLNEINPIPGSLASYLFDDFKGVIDKLSKHLKREKKLKIEFNYINEIQMAKGK